MRAAFVAVLVALLVMVGLVLVVDMAGVTLWRAFG